MLLAESPQSSRPSIRWIPILGTVLTVVVATTPAVTASDAATSAGRLESSPPPSTGANLWPNASLETDLDKNAVPDGWHRASSEPSMATVEEGEPTRDTNSLCIIDTRRDADAAWFSTPIPVVEPGYDYSLTWSQRVDSASARLTMLFFNEANQPVGDALGVPLSGNQGKWHTGSADFTAPRSAIKMSLQIASTVDGAGSVCFAGPDLRRLPSTEPPDIWRNGNLETDTDGDEIPDHWSKEGTPEYAEQLTWSDSRSVSGAHSLCVHRTDASAEAAAAYWLSDPVTVGGGNSYTLSLQQYFDDVRHLPPPNWGFDMMVAAQFLDDDGARVAPDTLMMVTGSSSGWEAFARQLQAPNSATQLRLKIGSDARATGTLCVDDITVAGPLPGAHPFATQFTQLPRNYGVPNWAEISKDYSTTALSGESIGSYGPLLRPYDVREWAADIPDYRGTYFGKSFSIPSYVGEQDLRKEAITDIGTLYAASLHGVDVSNHDGMDLISQMEVYNSVITADDGTKKGLIFNNPNFDGYCAEWYTLYPTILWGQLLDRYPAQRYQRMRNQFIEAARSWIEGIPAMQSRNWDFWCFNFKTGQPMSYEEAWGVPVAAKQPDLAMGIAWVSYLAWQQTGDPAFRDAATTAMADMADRTTGSPNYEIFGFFAPALAAKLNAGAGADLPVGTFFDWVFSNGFSRDVRPGYGMIADTWGEHDAHGLMGGTGNWGGYAFGLETNVALSAMAPVARYKPYLARYLGAWALQVANNLKIAYPEHLPPENQSDWEFVQRTGVTSIPHEGVKHYYAGQTPYATSDVRFWAPASDGWTDYAPYSAWSTGLLGALVSETNVRGVLQLDLLKTDTHAGEAYPTYSYYNPNPARANVKIDVGPTQVDVYDAVTHTFLAQNVNGEVRFTLEPQAARVLVTVPANADLQIDGQALRADGVVVDYEYP